MRKVNPSLSLLASAMIVLAAFSSCRNQTEEIPFPVSDSSYPQPVTVPLKISEPRKLSWVSAKSGVVKPFIRKMDLNALPSLPYDTTGFKTFDSPPSVVHFDYNQLPDTVFNLDKIPSVTLGFKTDVLEPPILVKAGLLIPKKRPSSSVSEMGAAMGLNVNRTFCTLEDQKGFIWIGTNRGIYRYDGEYFKVYENQVAVNLMEDRQGRIWFINDSKFGFIDEAKGTIQYSDKIHTVVPLVPKMIQDAAGFIWISRIASHTVVRVDPQALTFKNLSRSSGLPANGAWGVYEDHQKNIWLTTENGINIINPERNKIRRLNRINGLGSDTLRAITGDPSGRVWAVFNDGGMNAVDLAKGTITTYGKRQEPDLSIAYRMVYDTKNQLWIGTNRGLRVLNPEKNQYRVFDVKDEISEDFTLDVMLDSKKRIWACTFSGRIGIIDDNGATVHAGDTRIISTILEDSQGKIWMGATSSTDAIQILDREKKKIRILNKQTGLGDNFIQNILEKNGKIWISTDGGFDVIDPVHQIMEHLGKKEGLTSDTIYTVIKDIKGDTWFTGPSLGIDRIDSVTKMLFHSGVTQGISENNILDVRLDNQNRIWLATYTKGVDIIDIEKGTLRNIFQGAGLRDTCFKILMPDDAGRMWIGTDQGVYIADTKNASLTTITTKEGLSNNVISSMIPYKGKVVVGSQSKANILTPPWNTDSTTNKTEGTWHIASLEGSEGLVNSTNNWNTNIITKKDEYLWGGEGITIISGIRESKSTFPVSIVGLSVMNHKQNFNNPFSLSDKDTLWSGGHFYVKGEQPTAADLGRPAGMQWDSVSGSNAMPVNLRLPYNQNYIQFQFAQQHLGRNPTVLYSYVLEGIDKAWSPFSNKTFTDNYLNLSPGNYTFKVRSTNPNGHWGVPVSFQFSVLPPWWQTWWMYVLYVLALIGAIFGYNKYRSTALQKKNSLLEEKVQLRTLQVKQQADELTTINQISQALVSQADLSELIELVGNQLRDLFKANIVYIGLLDKKTKIINFPYQYGDNMQPLKLGEGLTSKIILSGESLLINKEVHEQTTELGIDRVGLPAASYLGVPIPVSDEIIGVLSIQSTKEENRFAEKDKYLLTTIAANVGVAIRKARLYEEVKQANTAADAARKTAEEANAAKSAFLSTVSHELRTPLTSVLGFTRITRKSLEEKIFPLTDKSDPKTVKTINQISANLSVVIAEGERLTNLINDVLDLAKIEAGKMEWNMEAVPMAEVMDRAIAATSALFQQKNLQLDKIIEPNLPNVSGDRDKLIQVVVNLLSNAVKFTEQGAVTCSLYFKEGAVVVGITDTGIGIAPADHDKVFEQFKQVGDTLTDKPKGTGLGLPICKEIVEHHDGKIWLESELGQGSTFYFMLPAITREEKALGHMPLNELLQQLKKRVAQSHPTLQTNEEATILVVDDDDGIRSLLKQELGEAGYHVDEAANGKEAIAKIRLKRPDLVILDVMMPEMNGFDVAAILKNDPQTMEIPIIILSIVQDKSRGFRIGVDRYLTKPIDTGLLFSEIGHLLEQGKSKKKVLVVDEDADTIRTLTDVLQARGYQVLESNGKELMEKAIANQPDIIILNSVFSDKQEIVRTLRFEKGMENVLFLIYQ